jgi:hypothetical protein
VLDAAHLFRWSTLAFLCNHWKLWTFVSPCYEFKISVALEVWFLYSQTFRNRFCTVLMDNSSPAGKSRIVMCRFYKKISPAIRLLFTSVLDLLGWLMPSLSGFVYFETSASFSNMPDSYYAPPPQRNSSSVYGDIWYTSKFILLLELWLLFWKVSDMTDLRVFQLRYL